MDDIEHGRSEAYETEVSATLGKARAQELRGARLSRFLMGADPRLVDRLIPGTSVAPLDLDHRQKAALARREAAGLPDRLPAPDPMHSQWWFTLESVVNLSDRAWELSRGSAAFLGASTAGYHYLLSTNDRCVILDVDRHVLGAIGPAIRTHAETVAYDVEDPLPDGLKASYSVVVADPPWYPADIDLFLARARELVCEPGYILTTLPPRLTRPQAEMERSRLLNRLLGAGFEILAIETQYLTYRVPASELMAYENVSTFTGRPWRSGDLLILKVRSGTESVSVPERRTARYQAFARKPEQYRVFVRLGKDHPAQAAWAVAVPKYKQSVSTRDVPVEDISAWDSDRNAVCLQDSATAVLICESWERGNDRALTIEYLKGKGCVDASARLAVDQMHEHLGLWRPETASRWRRTTRNLHDRRMDQLSNLAAQPTRRETAIVDDGFRLEFQRDRDRILWSQSLRRLANKTQLFPAGADDQLRRRLTHSVEVMQLAGTISRDFGLDADLTEAGALAHDLGHPPFGHPGEFALDQTLKQISPKLGGFNHYEHGADVVRWLEDAYLSPGAGGVPGLGLASETLECILKHTYFPSGSEFAQAEILKRSKHRDIILDGYCHLEGQAVRIADKISYLVSDLEDGIRLGAIGIDDLRKCRLFDHPPIDLTHMDGEDLYARFVSQRRALLRVLMEDVISWTDRQLVNRDSRDRVRAAKGYTVEYSPQIDSEVKEVWNELQTGILHKDPRVLRSNARAARIVSSLLLLFAAQPGLVDRRFADAHAQMRAIDNRYMAHYRRWIGRDTVRIPQELMSALVLERTIKPTPRQVRGGWEVELVSIVLAKDYVASLTDYRASLLYAELFSEGG